MTIDGAVLGRLKAVSAVTTIVGSGSSARIYALKLPQNPTLEAITFQQISGLRAHAFGVDRGTVEARFQVDIWGNTHEEARDLADAIRGDGAASALSRWSGTQDSTVVQDVLLNTELVFYEEATEDYRVMQDYSIWFEE